MYDLASARDWRRWANSALKDTWWRVYPNFAEKYASINTWAFLVLLTAAAKIMLLKISLSCYISEVIFPGLSQSTAVFPWLPLHFFTFHICSEHMSGLSLRPFPYTQHPHILKIHKSCILLLSFDQSFQLVTCSNWTVQIQGSCLPVGQLKSWTIFKTSALNDPLHQV